MNDHQARELARNYEARGYSVIYVHKRLIARIDTKDWVEILIDDRLPDRYKNLGKAAKEEMAQVALSIRNDIHRGESAYWQNIYRYKLSKDQKEVPAEVIAHMIRSSKDTRGHIPISVPQPSQNIVSFAFEEVFGFTPPQYQVFSLPRHAGKSRLMEALKASYELECTCEFCTHVRGLLNPPKKYVTKDIPYGQCCKVKSDDPLVAGNVYMHVKSSQKFVRITSLDHRPYHKLLDIATGEIHCVDRFQEVIPVNVTYSVDK